LWKRSGCVVFCVVVRAGGGGVVVVAGVKRNVVER
jgi:hypothetical protein